MQKINVLYIIQDVTVGGTSKSMLNLIHSVKDSVNPIVLLREYGPVYDKYKQEGIETIVVPFPLNLDFLKNDGNLLKYLITEARQMRGYLKSEHQAIRKAFCLLRERKVDIVHSASSAVTMGYGLSRKLGSKHVWHIREFIDLDFGTRPVIGFNLTKAMIYRSDYAIAITKSVYKHWGLDKMNNRSCVLWNAVRSRRDVSFCGDKEDYFLFCSAQLTKEKGIFSAIRAFMASGVSKKGYKLKIIGEAQDPAVRLELSNMLDLLDCRKNIDFLGFQNDVKPYMCKAKGLLMTSFNEAMGRTTVEAMFYGCPVIGRNSGGTAEIIDNKVNGFLFNTEQECANLIRNLSERTPINIINNAFAHVKDNFTEETYGVKIKDIYKKVLALA
ncbi:glycosyl transferase family 1 [Prevotella lacticifex]|uniref:glycosyltransferase n=1 Tax=Prevotella lacticifex TaxID=2854755 RepID=UPI001CC3A4F0|nr:glycosyltransferase [Prevotella lacticifex]GJG68794.1 glycosyl transferase family 1 [Prevotella lacticifex]